MNHIIYLNNIYEWFYKSLCIGKLEEISSRWIWSKTLSSTYH